MRQPQALQAQAQVHLWVPLQAQPLAHARQAQALQARALAELWATLQPLASLRAAEAQAQLEPLPCGAPLQVGLPERAYLAPTLDGPYGWLQL